MIVITIVFLFQHHVSHGKTFADETSESFGIMSALGLTGLILIQNDYPTIRIRSPAAKIMFLTVSLTCFALFAFYASVMTSSMISLPEPDLLGSVQEVIDGGYLVVVLGGSIYYDTLARSPKNSDLYRLFITQIQGRSRSNQQVLSLIHLIFPNHRQ